MTWDVSGALNIIWGKLEEQIWCGRRKIFTDAFHGDRDSTGYPPEKKLSQLAGKGENQGPPTHSKKFSGMFYWPLLAINMVSSLCAVLEDYRLLTFGVLQYGRRDGFHFSPSFTFT